MALEKLLILGASSMIGSHVLELVKDKYTILAPSHKELNLKKSKKVNVYFNEHRPQLVMNFAGWNGGIKLNSEEPYRIFLDNTQMILNIVGMSTAIKVRKFFSIIPSCSYPDDFIVREQDYWEGKPSESVACHGLAKRNLVAFCEQAHKQFDQNYQIVCLNTVYGPRDKFGKNAKVIGSLIKKFLTAKQENLPDVKLFGDGSQLRGFIYVKDAARAIVECFEQWYQLNLLNIESEEISIKDLAELIKNEVQYDGHINWSGELGGQQRKMLDFSKSRKLLTYRPEYDLKKGIHETVEWYLRNKV